MGKYLLVANLLCAGFLTGLIWYVQVVQYPQLADVGAGAFRAYHARHRDRTAWVVGPPMVVELGCAGLFVLVRPAGFPAPLAWAAAVLVLVVWAATFFVSVPLHAQLASGGDDRTLIVRLVRTNWLRTAAWTVRFGLLLYGCLLMLP